MKTIIAGSRDITDINLIPFAIELSKFDITEIVSGMARGIDILGYQYAKENNIPTKLFPVYKKDWKTIGKHAGHLRNEKMAEYADALIAIWDGKSKGTFDMIKRARKHKLKIFIYITDV